jgi:hypothetical protein
MVSVDNVLFLMQIFLYFFEFFKLLTPVPFNIYPNLITNAGSGPGMSTLLSAVAHQGRSIL